MLRNEVCLIISMNAICCNQGSVTSSLLLTKRFGMQDGMTQRKLCSQEIAYIKESEILHQMVFVAAGKRLLQLSCVIQL